MSEEVTILKNKVRHLEGRARHLEASTTELAVGVSTVLMMMLRKLEQMAPVTAAPLLLEIRHLADSHPVDAGTGMIGNFYFSLAHQLEKAGLFAPQANPDPQ